MGRRHGEEAQRPPGAWDLLGFLAFSHGWTWFFWALAARLSESIWQAPGVYFFYLGGAGVFLGAVVMSWALYGREGLLDLGRRSVDPRGIGAGWWAVILLLMPLLTLTAAAIAALSGAAAQPLDLAAALARLYAPVQLLVWLGFILILGPLPEEVGWRGYLLERLQLRWNALAASLLLGLIWWSWHLPLFVLPGYYDVFDRAPPTPLDSLYGILPSVILYTWIYNNTGRSVLAVILFHFVENLTGEFLGLAEEVRPIRLLLTALVATAVVIGWGPRRLRRTHRGG